MNFSKNPVVGTLAISFLGSLPPGIINIQISTYVFEKRYHEATAFSSGAVLSEMLLVSILILVRKRLALDQNRGTLLRVLGATVFAIFAGFSVLDVQGQPSHSFTGHSLVLLAFSGFLVNLLNPFQLPFWLGWLFILHSGNTLERRQTVVTGTIQGTMAGLGTVLALTLYAYLAHTLLNISHFNKQLLATFSGCSMAIVAGFQLYKFVSQSKTLANN